MKIKLSELKQIIKEELLKEEKEEDVNFNPDTAKLSMPVALKKLLDPNISPMKFAALDKEMDASDDPKKQAAAIAAFALNYSDMDSDAAIQLLQRAKTLAPKLVAMKDEKKNED
tara:strand:- start:230 stop:571 length:342 start_codon:yes stop_codon:yes gene_type:complete